MDFYDDDCTLRVVGELWTGRRGDDSAQGGECWDVCFAPDESRLAWSAGYRQVVLIPWHRYRTGLGNQDEEAGGGDLPVEGRGLAASASEEIRLDTNFLVTSMAFGTSTPQEELESCPSSRRGYYRRVSCTRHLLLATGHNKGRIRIWDPYTGRLMLDLTDHTKPVSSLAFARDGSLRLASGSEDGTVKIWDMTDDGNMFKTLREHRRPVRSVAWSPDSKLLCTAGDKQKVILWSAVNYTILCRLSGHYNDVLSCAFSPDGATLATASADTRVLVWDTCTGEPIRELNHVSPQPGVIYMSGSNGSGVNCVAFSPDGCHLATVCGDGLLRHWRLSSGQESVESARGSEEGDEMLNCSFSPLGGTLAVGHASGSVVLFSTPAEVPSLLHLARMSLRRYFGDVVSNRSFRLPYSLKPYLRYRQW